MQTILQDSIAELNQLHDNNFLHHIANSNISTGSSVLTDEWIAFRERHKKDLFALNYYTIFGKSYRPGQDEARETDIEHLTDETLSLERLKKAAETYNDEKAKNGILPWLCQISKSVYREWIKKGLIAPHYLVHALRSKAVADALDVKSYKSAEQNDVSSEQTDMFKRNKALIREYFLQHCTPLEIELLTAYYKDYDSHKKSHHMSKELIEKFRNAGISDDNRNQIILRLKKRINEALNSAINRSQ